MQAIKILVLFSCLALCTQADASQYYRFWRGWKIPVMNSAPYTYDLFEKDINEVFIPATVGYGEGKGLSSYLPVFPAEPEALDLLRKTEGVDLPDEIALVVYESKEAYDLLRSTPEGKKYGDLHKEYFDMATVPSKSKSAVPEAYTGALALEAAFDVLGSHEDWRTAQTRNRTMRFLIHVKKPGVANEAYLNQLNQYVSELKLRAEELGLISYLLLVSENYWIEYQIWNRGSDLHAYSDPVQKHIADIELGARNLPIFDLTPGLPGSDWLRYGSAANVQFGSAK